MRRIARATSRTIPRAWHVNEGFVKAAAILWIATQRDTQEARTQYLQWQTAEAKRQLMLTSNREHAAHWKVLHHMEAQRQIEESIRTLRGECSPTNPGGASSVSSVSSVS